MELSLELGIDCQSGGTLLLFLHDQKLFTGFSYFANEPNGLGICERLRVPPDTAIWSHLMLLAP